MLCTCYRRYSRSATQNYVGDVPGLVVDGISIPPLNLEDGPQGVADGTTEVTAWPSALTVVSSWDRSAMYDFGKGMSTEQHTKGERRTTRGQAPGRPVVGAPLGPGPPAPTPAVRPPRSRRIPPVPQAPTCCWGR